MNFLEESYEEKIDESHSKALLEGRLKTKKFSYLILTTTSIITGILILVTILTIISGIVSLSTILVDILMITWHIILLVRIYSIEKDLDIIKVESPKHIKQEDTSDENIDWI